MQRHALLAAILLFASNLTAQTRTLLATDPLIYSVAYLEVLPASRAASINVLKQYTETTRKDDGFLSLALLEQIGRPGHFVILEKWADQKSFDAHGMAESTKQLMARLDPVRVAMDQHA